MEIFHRKRFHPIVKRLSERKTVTHQVTSMLEPLKLIVYVSSAVSSLNDAALAGLLVHARASNRLSDVTGVLLFEDGDIMQVIEGPPDVVDKLFESIQRDRRHSSVHRLVSSSIDGREFPGWSMGFGRTIRQARKQGLPGEAAQTGPGDLDDGMWDASDQDSPARMLLKNFRKW